jgi:hypothetical protein
MLKTVCAAKITVGIFFYRVLYIYRGTVGIMYRKREANAGCCIGIGGGMGLRNGRMGGWDVGEGGHGGV